jgi:hypothetical protein
MAEDVKPQRRRGGYPQIPVLRECVRVQGTIKLWMLPDHRIIALEDLHYRWLIEQRHWLRWEFGIRAPKFGGAEEQRARVWALRRGLVRICLYLNGGRLIVEADARHWTTASQKVVDRLVRVNTEMIDEVETRLLDLGATPPGSERQKRNERHGGTR